MNNAKPRTTQAILVALVAVAINVYTYTSSSGIQELFTGFGDSLPLVSRWFVQYQIAALILLVAASITIMALLFAKQTENDALGRGLHMASIWEGSLSAILLFVVVLASYLPIYRIGSVV